MTKTYKFDFEHRICCELCNQIDGVSFCCPVCKRRCYTSITECIWEVCGKIDDKFKCDECETEFELVKIDTDDYGDWEWIMGTERQKLKRR